MAKIRVKNKNDTRYLKVQEKLERVIGRLIRRGKLAKLQVHEVSSEAGIYVSTFYDHFKNMDVAITQLDSKMSVSLTALCKEAEETGCSLEVTFSKILYFIQKNAEYYDMVTHRMNAVPLVQIVEIFRPLLCRYWRRFSAAENARIFQLYAWEFSGLIYYWGQQEKFDSAKIPEYSKRLARLTKTAPQRLA